MRILDVLSGLLSAGTLLAGVVLLVAAFVAPPVVAVAGLGVADGPGWHAVTAHLAVGVCGELVVLLRRTWPTVVRVSADIAVILGALTVIWWCWLP